MTTATATPEVAVDPRVKCEICGALVHSVQHHLKLEHTAMTLEEYQSKYPGAPILSEVARKKIEEHKAAKATSIAAATSVSTDGPDHTMIYLHDLFGLGAVAAAMSASSKPIPIRVLNRVEDYQDMIPDVDPNYVFNLDILKTLLMAIENNIPCYLWGHAGVGKTTIFEQIAARTNRPFMRVQHTANMEEEHIVGGWRLRDGKTVFELGPLPMAMKMGWLYVADEYDFGRPEVTSVYQAILEGKPLVIKEADPANRVIRPHPNFRVVGTGNTNGQGDESGLYQGTNMQNSANYERFGVVERMPYMEAKQEARVISQQARIPIKDAEKMVDFANRIRTDFDGGKLGNPISPRSLIYAGKLGMMKGNYKTGLMLSFVNRLTSTDREAAIAVAQRVFGA